MIAKNVANGGKAMNPYEVLGVERDASAKTIKSAYRKLARKWHPDLFQTEAEIKNAEGKMKEINEAYEILKTPEKRAAFDAANPASVNVYEYYANKQVKTKQSRKKAQDSTDIENEKQRRAVLQFLDVEYEHKNEILDMFAELVNGAVSGLFSEEEYSEYFSLVLEEVQDCITKIKKIVSVARAKYIIGLDTVFRRAEEVIEELTRKGNETPASLEEARYVEETRQLSEKIHELMSGFRSRFVPIIHFNLIDKTWEFDNDSQIASCCEKHKDEVEALLADMKWVQKTARERNIDVGGITYGSQNLSYSRQREDSLDECIAMLEKAKHIIGLNLQGLREEFWKTKCKYSKDSRGRTILTGIGDSFHMAEQYKGNFICPPHINGINRNAFYWLKKVESITIPAHAINSEVILLPSFSTLKKLFFTFGTEKKSVDVSKAGSENITRKGDYICVSGTYSERTFALVDAENVYLYDNEEICKLSGVSSMEQLENLSKWWRSNSEWKGYELQIHTWAQAVGKIPDPAIMMLLPTSVEAVQEWAKADKTNLEKTILINGEALKTRVIRLYIALGALNGSSCHAQAEWLISKLDVGRMYRSRLERYPDEMPINADPMFDVPKSAVDLVQENIDNKEFLPYVFAFLEGYRIFQTEARKQNVVLTAEFVINTAPQYIFHKKIDKTTSFVTQLLEVERDMNERIADKILRLYNISQRQLKSGIKKNIIETVDEEKNSVMHYKFVDMESLECYRALAKFFKCKNLANRHYGVETEDVFVSKNSHAITIMDGENKCVAIAILNLFDEGELFADIMYCENKSVDVLEAIRRALIDQKECNTIVTGISIGMNEAPRTTRYNEWHTVVQNSNVDWLKKIKWRKFEYVFKSRILGDAYKAYRTRFVIWGKEQYFSLPNPWDNPDISRRRNRRRW